jgi:hypothetical protein
METPKRNKMNDIAYPISNDSLSNIKASSSLIQSIKRCKSKLISPMNNSFLKSLNVYLSDDTTIQIKVSVQSAAVDVVQQIAQKVGLKNWDDFGLFLEDKGTIKLIDDDEIVLKFFYNLTKLQKKNHTKINKSADKEFDFEKKFGSRILFRKYLYLNPELEKRGTI